MHAIDDEHDHCRYNLTRAQPSRFAAITIAGSGDHVHRNTHLEIATTSTRATLPLSEVAVAFAKRYAREYDRPITTRYIGLMLRRVLEIRPYKTMGIYQVGLNREYLARRAAQFGVGLDALATRQDDGADRDHFLDTEDAEREE